MKKLFITLSIALLFISSCSKTDNANTSSLSSDAKKIGILQLVEHSALDQANKGFVDGLKEAGYEDGKNITIDYQNAQGEQANCVTISQKFINDKVDFPTFERPKSGNSGSSVSGHCESFSALIKNLALSCFMLFCFLFFFLRSVCYKR